jgi:hypothetical protein
MAKKPKRPDQPIPPEGPSDTHYRFEVKRSIAAAGTQFRPGVRYTAKAAVYEQVKPYAMNAQQV